MIAIQNVNTTRFTNEAAFYFFYFFLFFIYDTNPIGHFGKYHNTLCLSPQILHKYCSQFLLGLRMVPRENKNNAYAKFGGRNKEYYGIFFWPIGCSISGVSPLS